MSKILEKKPAPRESGVSCIRTGNFVGQGHNSTLTNILSTWHCLHVYSIFWDIQASD